MVITANPFIDETRIYSLNDRLPAKGRYVLYLMQQSQRTRFNHALEYAVQRANALKLPLLTVTGLMESYPEATWRHYQFMLEGLCDVQKNLKTRKIGFRILKGIPSEVALGLAGEAALIVCDRGYLRHQRSWRQEIATSAPCPVIEVESDAVVPVECASIKREYAARTLRPKIERLLDRYLVGLSATPVEVPFPPTLLTKGGIDPSRGLPKSFNVDRCVAPVNRFKGGEQEAQKRLDRFVSETLSRYATHRNKPEENAISEISPYLHFGQLSPLDAALAASHGGISCPEAVAVFIEELVVRRELAINYTWFEPDYDTFEAAAPAWAQETLAARGMAQDLYTREELTACNTHDTYWNAAMAEMVHTGFMHNYMRMYWGKKILEWSHDAKEAYETALYLNNRYFLDGRDPNSYAGVGWTFGLHDRAWPQQPGFGKVRSMKASGLKRKCNIQGYVQRVEALVREGSGHDSEPPAAR
ncbi:deoxyribodipyrimidine photo-lyase [Desulfoluna spongiiphila]|uniref:Deoxyribodipyrimidine photo-lyase n=1 Tax=Desulfoluna spongiiphila TaxID=419481 RepID=A0A1G5HVU3_9BACT|nr:deoxyribodipyrimidine photo-lyase [Desulfoluna spongiiphila]SCY67883.1 deoxyribodipyrimidine photo-lyase [Desulfoluna spongiiphila]